MPEHVHAVIMRHRNSGEQIIGHLKTRATQAEVSSSRSHRACSRFAPRK